MFRLLPVGLLLLPLISVAIQVPPGQAPKQAENVITLVKLHVEPMAPPKPALKYQLLPEFKELQPGNPIFGYAKCFAESQDYFYGTDAVESCEKWLALPIGQLPTEVRAYVDRGPLKRFDDAARLDSPHWGMLADLRQNGLGTLLSDVQILRQLAVWNRIRMRYAVQERRFNDAIAHAKSGFQLARHLDENMTLIGDLVGVAIGTVTCEPLEEMISQPGAPNLFWAWSFLPSPLARIEKGTRGENVLVYGDFGALCDPKQVWGDDELTELRAKLVYLPSYADLSREHLKTLIDWIQPRLVDETWLQAERKECVAAKFPPEKVERYPPEQLVFHALLRKFEAGRDDTLKYLHLPFWQIQERISYLNEKVPPEATVDQLCSRYLVGTGLYKVKAAQSRLEQRVSMLRIAEALRWHAAEHGQFPKKLSDFKEPLPDDPMTGKPFKYEFDGEVAHLRGTPPKGLEKVRGYTLHYEIRMR